MDESQRSIEYLVQGSACSSWQLSRKSFVAKLPYGGRDNTGGRSDLKRVERHGHTLNHSSVDKVWAKNLQIDVGSICCFKFFTYCLG